MTGSAIIEQDGPRRITRCVEAIGRSIRLRFAAYCRDCRWAGTFDYRHDAQDALDAHRCERQP